MFGLARGGSCRGMVFEVADADWHQVYAYLQEREQVTKVYRDVMRPVRLADGRMVSALAFVVDEQHEQYAGRLELERQLAMVRQGQGDIRAQYRICAQHGPASVGAGHPGPPDHGAGRTSGA